MFAELMPLLRKCSMLLTMSLAKPAVTTTATAPKALEPPPPEPPPLFANQVAQKQQ